MGSDWGPRMSKTSSSNDGWADLDRDPEDLSEEEAAEELRKQEIAYDTARKLPNRTLTASLVLWQRGFTYQEIADMQGYRDAMGAKIAIEAAVVASGIGTDDIAMVRKKAELTLDIFSKICFDYATSQGKNVDQGAWIDRGVRVLDRKLRLLGADAPTVIKISPDAGEMERYAQLLAVAAGASQAIEADPFDMDEIDGEVVEDEG